MELHVGNSLRRMFWVPYGTFVINGKMNVKRNRVDIKTKLLSFNSIFVNMLQVISECHGFMIVSFHDLDWNSVDGVNSA